MHALELVVQHLRGRKKEQRAALGEKAKAKQRVGRLWEQLVSWSSVPQAVSDELRVALGARGALGDVLRQEYPWGKAKEMKGAPRIEASLKRHWLERERSKEELRLIAAEVKVAVACYERRVAMLESRLGSIDGGSSEGRILSLHLRRNRRLLAMFSAFGAGEEV